jgi:hypothetical protein
MSISAWIKPQTTGSERTIVDRLAGNGVDGYRFTLRNDGRLSFCNLVSPSALSNDAWHHVVVTKYRVDDPDYSQYTQLYIDGSLARSGYVNCGYTNPDQKTLIGLRESGSAPFKGYMDNVAIWHEVLSSSKISQLYNNNGQFYTGSETVQFVISPQEYEYGVEGSTIIQDNVWYSVAGTYDQGKSGWPFKNPVARLYINGNKEGEKVILGPPMSPPDWIDIGAVKTPWTYGLPINHFSGLIDEVKVYNRTLTQQEVRDCCVIST